MPGEPLLDVEDRLGACLIFLVLLTPTLPITGMRGGESYHTFLDELAMTLGELEAGTLSEALAPLERSMLIESYS